MIGIVYKLVAVAAAIWVYRDAASNGIGRIAGDESRFNVYPWIWSFATLLLWFVVLPFYSIHRAGLIERAKEDPGFADTRDHFGWKNVIRGGRYGVGAGLLIFGLFLSAGGVALMSGGYVGMNSGIDFMMGLFFAFIPGVVSALAGYGILRTTVETGRNPL